MPTPPPSPCQRHFPVEWTNTDQEIFESLLLADGPDEAMATPPLSNATGAPSDLHLPTGPGFRAIISIQEDEERKARHREVQRRFVRRKKEELERIRQEVALLEKQSSYLKLAQELHVLVKENEDMIAKCVAPPPMVARRDVEFVLETECQVAQGAFTNLKNDEYNDILRVTMQRVEKVLRREYGEIPRNMSAFQFLGWKGLRMLESHESQSTMQFRVSKTFVNISALEMLERLWIRIATVEGYRKLFSASLIMKGVVLQQVNEDAMIIFRTFCNPRTSAITRSTDLVCRIERNEELLLIVHSVKIDSIVKSISDSTGWCRSLSVLGFKDNPDAGRCAFRFSGVFKDRTSPNLKFWLEELLFVMVRYESTLVAPLITFAA